MLTKQLGIKISSLALAAYFLGCAQTKKHFQEKPDKFMLGGSQEFVAEGCSRGLVVVDGMKNYKAGDEGKGLQFNGHAVLFKEETKINPYDLFGWNYGKPVNPEIKKAPIAKLGPKLSFHLGLENVVPQGFRKAEVNQIVAAAMSKDDPTKEFTLTLPMQPSGIYQFGQDAQPQYFQLLIKPTDGQAATSAQVAQVRSFAVNLPSDDLGIDAFDLPGDIEGGPIRFNSMSHTLPERIKLSVVPDEEILSELKGSLKGVFLTISIIGKVDDKAFFATGRYADKAGFDIPTAWTDAKNKKFGLPAGVHNIAIKRSRLYSSPAGKGNICVEVGRGVVTDLTLTAPSS